MYVHYCSVGVGWQLQRGCSTGVRWAYPPSTHNLFTSVGLMHRLAHLKVMFRVQLLLINRLFPCRSVRSIQLRSNWLDWPHLMWITPGPTQPLSYSNVTFYAAGTAVSHTWLQTTTTQTTQWKGCSADLTSHLINFSNFKYDHFNTPNISNI